MTARSALLDDTTLAMGPALDEAAAVAILAHGRGGSASDMRNLAVALANPAIRFLMPAAPGGTWYPESFLAPIAANEPSLSRSLATYAALVDAVMAAGVPAEDIVLGGFSQGACLTAEFAIRNPRPYGAILILTGGLIGPPGTRWPVQPSLQGVPVYLSGSTTDGWVPPARVAETARVLSASGALLKLSIFDNRAHEVSQEEVASARDLLSRWTHRAGNRRARQANN